jgi:peptidoglycan/LPS O-acetylase OafA/YrhL
MTLMPETDAPGIPEKHVGRQRFLVLDGIRGLAIIGVLLTHAGFSQAAKSDILQSRLFDRVFELGWTGVDLFFVLSGFLITGILIDTKSAFNRASSFYGRRTLRIFPIYYLTIAIVLIAQTQSAWLSEAAADMHTWLGRLAYIFYFADLMPLWHHGNAAQTILCHFWSLAVEEQFYLIWPLIVWRVQSKTVYKICGAALCLTLLIRITAGAHFAYGAWIQFFPLTRGDGLFVGSALAAIFASHKHVPKKVLAGLTIAGLAALSVVAFSDYREFFYGGPHMFTFGLPALAILFGVLIAYCLEFGATPVAKLFQLSWLRSFGKYSYGLYVFHLPIYFLFAHLTKEYTALKFPMPALSGFAYLALIISVSYGVAWLSFNCFEQRFLRLKRFFEPEFGVVTPATKAARLGEPVVEANG